MMSECLLSWFLSVAMFVRTCSADLFYLCIRSSFGCYAISFVVVVGLSQTLSMHETGALFREVLEPGIVGIVPDDSSRGLNCWNSLLFSPWLLDLVER